MQKLRMLRTALFATALISSGGLRAEIIPPAPAHYFNDYAGKITPAVARDLDGRLEQFEHETSNQIVVAVFPKMESESSIEDYTVRVAQQWKVGQKQRNNGAVLFVFIEDRKMYLQVGYGLEGVLTDALSRRIIDNEIKPHFKQGDFDGGLKAGVDAILRATRGEYRGKGQDYGKVAQDIGDAMVSIFVIFLVIILIGCILFLRYLQSGGVVFSSSGSSGSFGGSGGGGSDPGGGKRHVGRDPRFCFAARGTGGVCSGGSGLSADGNEKNAKAQCGPDLFGTSVADVCGGGRCGRP